ncbi:MAG: flavodoxin family protein [Pseudomonadota bacterium]
MKAIVINAAPRMEAGNTQMILTPFLVGLRHEGAKVDIALLARKKINRCEGCFTCYAATPGECVHHDDMPGLIERIRNADTMVFATPIYLDGMTSLAKTFVDRLVTFLDPHFVAHEYGFRHPLRWKFPERLFLVAVCGYPGLHNFDPLVLHMKRIAVNLHAEFSGALLRPAVFSVLLNRKYPGRIRNVMDACRSAGEEFARSGGASAETLDAAAQDVCSEDELMATANAYWDRELERGGDQPA